MFRINSVRKLVYIGFLMIVLASFSTKVVAQVEDQERYFGEFGVSGGGAFSLGDANGVLFRYMEPYGAAFFKYKFNGYLELKVQGEGGLVGVSNEPGMKKHSKTFGFQVTGEYNFFNWGVKKYEEHSSWAAPYITLGVGLVVFDGQAAFAIPMGVGGKFRVHDRVNLGVQWTVSKVLHDNFDGIDDPIGLNKGFWNNRDWYSSVQVYISFNFLKKCAPCRNGVMHF